MLDLFDHSFAEFVQAGENLAMIETPDGDTVYALCYQDGTIARKLTLDQFRHTLANVREQCNRFVITLNGNCYRLWRWRGLPNSGSDDPKSVYLAYLTSL